MGVAMRVRVLQAGVYNGPDHHEPVRALPGDVIEVAGGWYAAELIAKGLVAEFNADVVDRSDQPPGPSEIQVAAGPSQQKPFEPRGKKLSELRRLSDAKE